MEIVFATQNKGKFEEAREKLSKIGVKLFQYDRGYPEIQADDLIDVALYGARYLARKIDKPFFLEDAGLFIRSLSNFPGVYSAYVFKRIGCKGILKLMEDKKDRYAEFRSVIVYKEKGKRTKIFIGKCEGEIAFEEKGNRGFGFDPIFIPYGSSKTFGEMDVEEKNKYSHRGKSVEMLVKYLEKMRNH